MRFSDPFSHFTPFRTTQIPRSLTLISPEIAATVMRKAPLSGSSIAQIIGEGQREGIQDE